MGVEIFWVVMIVVAIRVIWRKQSITSVRMWITSIAGSMVGVFITTAIVAATMFPVVGH